MIRIVTRTHLARLTEQADAAHARAREVQGLADAAFGSHIREVFALTARAEDAEKEAATATRDIQHLQIAHGRHGPPNWRVPAPSWPTWRGAFRS